MATKKYQPGRHIHRQLQIELNGLSRGWHESLAIFIWNRDKSLCIYCGAPGQEVDHVVPKFYGGPSISGNGVLACTRCNMRKGRTLSFDFLVRAFKHLLTKGEDLSWVERLWFDARLSVAMALEKSQVNREEIRESWDEKP